MAYKISWGIIKSIISLYIIVFISASSVSAYSIPTFPTCLNTQGTLSVTHNDGPHGVPGDATTYYGIDSVYTLSDDTTMQCLCPPNGSGVQTNWWKVSTLSDDEINQLKKAGWIYIPTGAAWGLQDAPYLAKNSSYSCVGGAGGSSSSSSSNDSSSSNSSTSTSSSSTESTPQPNKVGDILGLASTGNIATVLFYFACGVSLLTTAFILRSKKTV